MLESQFSALGLILAALAIVRYQALDDRDCAEYVLIGTLTALLIALLVGMGIRSLLFSEPAVRRFTGVNQPRLTAALVATVVAAAGCSGDPYARYAATLHQDVDAAMVAAFQMTARLQLTVVHNQIPDDSLPVARDIVMRAAHDVDQSAAHFRSVSAPGDLARVHADLSLELSQVAAALDSLGAALQRCAAADPTCQARLDSLSQRFSFMGEDLNMARSRVQRLLQAHGILLRRVG